ncbi:hypothetical protein V6N11_009341 [Hibiscus sabdariffa]|uniref:Uncharacterized protein n=1 Tax=Hibiscus sabdariffa TaxID=183260 RepID=A0ABR2NSL0_9ROSI
MCFTISLVNTAGLLIIAYSKGRTSIEELAEISPDMKFKGWDVKCQKEFEVVRRQYSFEKLKCKPKNLRLTFKEGIQVLDKEEDEQRRVFVSRLACLIYLQYMKCMKLKKILTSSECEREFSLKLVLEIIFFKTRNCCAWATLGYLTTLLNEFAPIVIQLVFVHQLGAINNFIMVKCPKDLSGSLRKPDQLEEKDSQEFEFVHTIFLKLSPKQETICANRVLLLHANKKDQARKLVSILLELFLDCVMPILFQVVVLERENKVGEFEEMLGQYAEILAVNVAKLYAHEARMQEFKTNMAALGSHGWDHSPDHRTDNTEEKVYLSPS